MSAGSYNITIEQGVTTQIDFQWKDAAGVPINLTGYSARMQVRPSLTSPDILLDCTTANSKLVITAGTGIISLRLSATETAALTVEAGVYDLEVVDGSNKVTRLLQGAYALSKEVTR